MSDSSGSSDSSSDNECNDCNSTKTKKCDICDEILCDEHTIGYLKEWLMYQNEHCVKCRKSGCHNCMITCFSCANQGDHSDWCCIDCNEKYGILDEVDCSYHQWYKCGDEHESEQNDECPECRANRNYAGRME